jgi:LysM repeat protein/3D (Asp-Asp-Asp) domain-containing protein
MRLLTWLTATSMLVLAGWPSAGLADGAVNVHTVQPGESVRSIADANGISSETILAANTMSDPDLLHVGQQLLIPSADGVLHTVAQDETLSEIADSYGVNTSDIAAANGLMGSADQITVGMVLVVPGAKLASSAVAGSSPAQGQAATPTQAPASAPAASASPTTYTVKDGDTLLSIADAFNLDILSLVAMNGIDDADLIRPGSTLRVSAPPKEYVVQAGDTLSDIAYRYSVPSQALLKANGLADPDLIVAGMTLVMPTGAALAPAAAAPVAAAPAPAAAPRSNAQAPAQSAPSRASAPAAAAPAAQSRPAAAAAPATAAAPASGSRVISALVTGYAPGAGASSSRTASGSTTHWGTVAADTRLYPFGTRLRIQGLGDTVFVVEDTGGAVRGNVFDVWYPDAASARGIGPGTRQVTILGPGDS